MSGEFSLRDALNLQIAANESSRDGAGVYPGVYPGRPTDAERRRGLLQALLADAHSRDMHRRFRAALQGCE